MQPPAEHILNHQGADNVRVLLKPFPHLTLGTFPSPVTQVTSAEGHRFWIKDDGRCATGYGGNKVRKLEYLLAEIQKCGTKVLVVHGDVESHTVQACAIWGSQMGLAVHAVVFPYRNQSLQVPELARLRAIPVQVHLRRTMLGAILQAHWIGWRKHGYVVPLGASTPTATLGFISAAGELSAQIRAGLLPEPQKLYLPFATGGSVAGLLIGFTLAGMSTRVVAVQTVERIIANRNCLERLVKKTLAILQLEPGLLDSCMNRLLIIDRHNLGRHYRDVPPQVVHAVATAREYGLALEPAFSGKAFASLLDDLSQYPHEELLFWNTHNQQSLGNKLEPQP